jgi:tRNA (guanine37-N1)-methyltransferase
MMRFTILTLFPEMFEGVINQSIIKRAREKGLIEINLINYRDFATNKHGQVDDYAYGGGAGMVISVEPIHLALTSISGLDKAKKILTSASGYPLTQKKLNELKNEEHLVIVCGHYEGIDNRITHYIDEEISVGDYVLTGGEIPAMVLLDGVTRLIPGVISEESIENESYSDELLEYPQYTRPPVYDGHEVPEILLSGHHANIKKWQRAEALKKTKKVRPDLLEKAALTPEDYAVLRGWEEK